MGIAENTHTEKGRMGQFLSKYWFVFAALIVASILIYAFISDKREWKEKVTEKTQEALAKQLDIPESDVPEPYLIENRNDEVLPKYGIKFEPEELEVYDVSYEYEGKEYLVVYWWEVALGAQHLDVWILEK